MEALKPRGLPLREALRIKSAELWLEVGQPSEALLELQKLPKRSQQDTWAQKVLQTAIAMMTRSDETKASAN